MPCRLRGLYWTILYIAVYLQYKCRLQEEMATAKTTTLTFRIQADVKEAVRTAADNEHRSIANMVEVMIRDYCGRVGVPIQDERAPRLGGESKPKPRKR